MASGLMSALKTAVGMKETTLTGIMDTYYEDTLKVYHGFRYQGVKASERPLAEWANDLKLRLENATTDKEYQITRLEALYCFEVAYIRFQKDFASQLEDFIAVKGLLNTMHGSYPSFAGACYDVEYQVRPALFALTGLCQLQAAKTDPARFSSNSALEYLALGTFAEYHAEYNHRTGMSAYSNQPLLKALKSIPEFTDRIKDILAVLPSKLQAWAFEGEIAVEALAHNFGERCSAWPSATIDHVEHTVKMLRMVSSGKIASVEPTTTKAEQVVRQESSGYDGKFGPIPASEGHARTASTAPLIAVAADDDTSAPPRKLQRQGGSFALFKPAEDSTSTAAKADEFSPR